MVDGASSVLRPEQCIGCLPTLLEDCLEPISPNASDSTRSRSGSAEQRVVLRRADLLKLPLGHESAVENQLQSDAVWSFCQHVSNRSTSYHLYHFVIIHYLYFPMIYTILIPAVFFSPSLSPLPQLQGHQCLWLGMVASPTFGIAASRCNCPGRCLEWLRTRQPLGWSHPFVGFHATTSTAS